MVDRRKFAHTTAKPSPELPQVLELSRDVEKNGDERRYGARKPRR
jgi:hypothetical protein